MHWVWLNLNMWWGSKIGCSLYMWWSMDWIWSWTSWTLEQRKNHYVGEFLRQTLIPFGFGHLWLLLELGRSLIRIVRDQAHVCPRSFFRLWFSLCCHFIFSCLASSLPLLLLYCFATDSQLFQKRKPTSLNGFNSKTLEWAKLAFRWSNVPEFFGS